MTKMIKKIACIISLLALTGCASSNPKPVPQPQPIVDTTGTNNTLAEAATSVSRSLVDLNQIEQAANPPKRIATEADPATYGMDAMMSVDWSGPVEPLIRHLAEVTDYRVRVVGSAPALPVLVTLSAKRVPAADILRDAAYQCGKRAQIIVFPATKTIEIRYASA
jgi:defect-in-organelle-trafficking protein DotD